MMLNQQRAAAYLQASGEGATVLDLLLISYDGLIATLHQVGQAVAEGNIARRCSLTNRILMILGHLESWALRDQDPALVEGLQGWYQFLRQRLHQLQVNGASRDFEELASLVGDVRQTWKQKQDLLQAAHRGHTSTYIQEEYEPSSWSA